MKKNEGPEDNGGEIEFVDLEEEERKGSWDYGGSQDHSALQRRSGTKWDEEPEEAPWWKKTAVFAVLVILAALIALGLWFFTHRDHGPEPEDPVTGPSAAATETPAGPGEFSDAQTMPPEGGGAESGAESSEPEAPSQEPEDFGAEPGDAGAGTGNPGTEPADSGAGAGNPGTEPGSSAAGTGSVPDVPEPQDGNGTMSFESVSESVTPKDVVNLRSVPSTAEESSIVTQVKNGEVLSRVGINPDTGWSAIDFDGRTLYAVTQYLTTDLSYKTPVTPTDPNRISTLSGRVIIFSDCDDQVTPKEYVNLRTEPSTTEGEATVSCQVSKGENLHRTGISPDSGWSRVEYNGQILYVVSSLLQAAQ